MNVGGKILHALAARPRSASGYAGALYLAGQLEKNNQILEQILKVLCRRPVI